MYIGRQAVVEKEIKVEEKKKKNKWQRKLVDSFLAFQFICATYN